MNEEVKPLFGWRIWRRRRVIGEQGMWSVLKWERWPADAPLAARHIEHRRTAFRPEPPRLVHPSPAPIGHPCQDCGIHAYYSMEALADNYADNVFGQSRRDIVGGAVLLWGNIIHHETGLRAQMARPLCLISDLQEVIARYHVPDNDNGLWIPHEADPWHSTTQRLAEHYGILVLDFELAELYARTWGNPAGEDGR